MNSEGTQNKEIYVDDEDMYKYCPICAEPWENHTSGLILDENGKQQMECNPLRLIMLRKPRFYVIDVDNYNEEFLKSIILWQDEYINYLVKENLILKEKNK